ncbi:hypothetical protein LINGRAHAP2_LOCUS30737 [Linum grandiflorum]
MRAIVNGLNIAWNLVIRCIRVKSNSMAAIPILLMSLLFIINMRPLLCSLRSFVAATWEVNLSHIYRETNNTMNYLGNLGHSLNYGLYIFDTLDRDMFH